MVNKKDEQYSLGVQLTIFVVVVAIIVGVSYIGYNISMEPYDKVCQDLGFNKSTGYDYDNCGGGKTSTTIECDGDYINYFSDKKVCVSKDKWGDCNNYETDYYLVNYSC